MRYRYRRQLKLGPLRMNFTQNGFTSWGLKVGPWSWNSRTNKQKLNTPGPGYIEFGGPTRKDPR